MAALAQDFSRQVFPDAPITMVGGLNLSKGVEGMLMPRGDGSGEWGIIYNETIRSPGRRNFTLAHELGHYLLHRRAHPGGLKCTNRNMTDWDEARNRIEGEANTFASYLLMPLDDFREQIKGRVIDIDLMTELSDRYAVSLTAAILKWMDDPRRPKTRRPQGQHPAAIPRQGRPRPRPAARHARAAPHRTHPATSGEGVAHQILRIPRRPARQRHEQCGRA